MRPRAAANALLILLIRDRRAELTVERVIGLFTHWQLKITGKKADYSFYGELGTPMQEKQNE